MKKRQITMQDGRYLIFYTFEDEAAKAGAVEKKERDAAASQPEAKPVAEEERRV